MAISRVCSIPDCDKPHLARGLCSGHYLRRFRTGDLDASVPIRERRTARGSCSIPDCGKPHYGNGFCAAHNKRHRKYGDPLFLRAAPNGEPARFFNEVVLIYDGDDCLAWPYGTTDQGYGVLTINGKRGYAHRLVCEVAHGPAPTPDYEAAHSCGRGGFGCVTRRHLSWKTGVENSADKLIHGTVTRGSRHGGAKLTEDAVREIRTMPGTSEVWERLARQFGVSVWTIRNAQCRRSWAWLDPL